jgi:hypothetical protein
MGSADLRAPRPLNQTSGRTPVARRTPTRYASTRAQPEPGTDIGSNCRRACSACDDRRFLDIEVAEAAPIFVGRVLQGACENHPKLDGLSHPNWGGFWACFSCGKLPLPRTPRPGKRSSQPETGACGRRVAPSGRAGRRRVTALLRFRFRIAGGGKDGWPRRRSGGDPCRRSPNPMILPFPPQVASAVPPAGAGARRRERPETPGGAGAPFFTIVNPRMRAP